MCVFADTLPIVAPPALYSAFVQPMQIFVCVTFLLLAIYLMGTAVHSGYGFVQPSSTNMHDLHYGKSHSFCGALNLWIGQI